MGEPLRFRPAAIAIARNSPTGRGCRSDGVAPKHCFFFAEGGLKITYGVLHVTAASNGAPSGPLSHQTRKQRGYQEDRKWKGEKMWSCGRWCTLYAYSSADTSCSWQLLIDAAPDDRGNGDGGHESPPRPAVRTRFTVFFDLFFLSCRRRDVACSRDVGGKGKNVSSPKEKQ